MKIALARTVGASVDRSWLTKRSVVVTAACGALVAAAGVVLAAGPGRGMFSAAAAQSSNGSRRADNAAKRGRSAAALRVVSVTPSSGAQGVNGAHPIKVTFSAPVAKGSPSPSLSPAIPGTWRRRGDAMVFIPTVGFVSGTHVTVTVPGGPSGMRSAAGARNGGGLLSSSVTRTFSTAGYSTLRLQQLLAQLGYLPLTWTPSGTAISPTDAKAQLAAAYTPPSGTFNWQGGYPSALGSFWQQGTRNLIDVGAVRAFESQNGLTMNGVAGSRVWKALLRDVSAGKDNANGYTYAIASKASPETLTIWHDGHVVLRTPANTGIAAARTADGTFPVYERLPYQVMQGTNPDGSQYADPVQYVSYFNGGDAVHYIARAAYGFPQSLGCVELPLGAAATAYKYLTYGTLVTVR